MATPALDALRFDHIDGMVSIWCGRPDQPPSCARYETTTHYAASTMKLAVMAAAYRLHELGRLDLDSDIEVHDTFRSQAPDTTFRNDPDYDNDPEPWQCLGTAVPLRWLVRRMIVKSSNLATNLVLERIGLESVADIWSDAGATSSIVARGIEDYPARDHGLENVVSAADLAALLTAIHRNRLVSPMVGREMLEVLLAQEQVDDVVRGLPSGTKVAHKNGWVDGIRHSAALIMPTDAPEFLLVTCTTTTTLDEAAGTDVIAEVAAAAWADRHLV